MPELPEVETIAVALRDQIVGERIVEVSCHPSPRFSGAAAAAGSTVVSVDRRGKYLLLGLDQGRELIVHLGMTGQLSVVEGPPGGRYVRAVLRFESGRALELRDVRRFGRVVVVDAGEYSALPGLARLGPEPLGPAFDVADFAAALARPGAALKARLLEGRLVAGVGNIYADEALWSARIHPQARRLDPPASTRLHQAIIEALWAGLEHGGTTLRDYRRLDGTGGSHQQHLTCYGRAGQPCLRCGTALTSTTVAGRTSTYCPSCQELGAEPDT